MQNELGRARRRGHRVVMPEQVTSPMDLNPTLEVSAALIADCVRQADHEVPDRSLANSDLPDHDLADPHRPTPDGVDGAMRQAVEGSRSRRETA